jgi:hypothetical protein|tara:strand:+ start:4511 stop:4747 length:237 start_codon:yes stop_codon:yes gene_type:complete
MKTLFLIACLIVCTSCNDDVHTEDITKFLEETKLVIQKSETITNELDTLSNIVIEHFEGLKVDSLISQIKNRTKKLTK